MTINTQTNDIDSTSQPELGANYNLFYEIMRSHQGTINTIKSATKTLNEYIAENPQNYQLPRSTTKTGNCSAPTMNSGTPYQDGLRYFIVLALTIILSAEVCYYIHALYKKYCGGTKKPTNVTKQMDKTEEPDQTKTADKTEKMDKVEKSDQAQQMNQTKKLDKVEDPDQAKKLDKTETPAQTKKLNKTKKSDKVTYKKSKHKLSYSYIRDKPYKSKSSANSNSKKTPDVGAAKDNKPSSHITANTITNATSSNRSR